MDTEFKTVPPCPGEEGRGGEENCGHLLFHLFLDRGGRWGTTDNFKTSFLQFFSVLHCPLALGEPQACPFLDVVFPPLFLSALSSSIFIVPCEKVLTRPDARETCPYQFSVRLFTMVRRDTDNEHKTNRSCPGVRGGKGVGQWNGEWVVGGVDGRSVNVELKTMFVF